MDNDSKHRLASVNIPSNKNNQTKAVSQVIQVFSFIKYEKGNTSTNTSNNIGFIRQRL